VCRPGDRGSVPRHARGGGRRPRRAEPPPIQDVLKRGQTIICQVSKEPISTKGPRVTAQVSLAGRFLVFMPFASRVGVSRKIGDRAERQRLREQVQKVLPKDSGGVIVRTVGEDVTQETFTTELTTLITQWAKIHKKQKFVGSAPKLLHRETSLTPQPVQSTDGMRNASTAALPSSAPSGAIVTAPAASADGPRVVGLAPSEKVCTGMTVLIVLS
jgi:Rne/Rng family ribonuclease